MPKSGRKAKKQETVKISGLHIYHDNRDRLVYYNIFNHMGYIIEGYEKTYRSLSMRYIVSILACLLSYLFEFGVWISLAIGIAALVFMELRFRKFLKGLPKIENFKPSGKTSILEGAASQEQPKIILKALLWLAFGICIIINAHMKGYTDSLLMMNYLISVFAFGVTIVQIIAFFNKRKTL